MSASITFIIKPVFIVIKNRGIPNRPVLQLSGFDLNQNSFWLLENLKNVRFKIKYRFDNTRSIRFCPPFISDQA